MRELHEFLKGRSIRCGLGAHQSVASLLTLCFAEIDASTFMLSLSRHSSSPARFITPLHGETIRAHRKKREREKEREREKREREK